MRKISILIFCIAFNFSLASSPPTTMFGGHLSIREGTRLAQFFVARPTAAVPVMQAHGWTWVEEYRSPASFLDAQIEMTDLAQQAGYNFSEAEVFADIPLVIQKYQGPGSEEVQVALSPHSDGIYLLLVGK